MVLDTDVVACTSASASPQQTSKMPRTNTAETTSTDIRLHLLGLPRELRDAIYDFAIVAPILIEHPKRLSKSNQHQDLSSLRADESDDCVRNYVALSRTCLQIYQEVKGRFYGNNTFATWIFAGKQLPLHNMDNILVHVKHVVLCYYEPRCNYDRRILPCVLDLRFKQASVEAKVTVAPPKHTLVTALALPCLGIANSDTVTAEARCEVEYRVGLSLQKLRTGLSKEGGLTAELMTPISRVFARYTNPLICSRRTAIPRTTFINRAAHFSHDSAVTESHSHVLIVHLAANTCRLPKAKPGDCSFAGNACVRLVNVQERTYSTLLCVGSMQPGELGSRYVPSEKD
ncbi:hypothetical protein LTR56_005712 [Elasticomyces elasticus]|nr:hypothetical protein LTR56_005712 [Elasticomyces elasticus]KAK3657491.1 hypothetical protein LTR22_009357 [Elasticomyces elasticus]KAK4907376.1 hypothetical protein LTR49_023612 [Elasticomyces elasticus]KAK5764974.1 hypothetical protein LTS12_004752 [Elasticomyces elasticus]